MKSYQRRKKDNNEYYVSPSWKKQKPGIVVINGGYNSVNLKI